MASLVRLLHPGMRALIHGDGVRADLTARAERVLAAARSVAPVETGRYHDSLHIVQRTTDRAAVAVGSDAPHAMRVETRSGVLARSLDAAG